MVSLTLLHGATEEMKNVKLEAVERQQETCCSSVAVV